MEKEPGRRQSQAARKALIGKSKNRNQLAVAALGVATLAVIFVAATFHMAHAANSDVKHCLKIVKASHAEVFMHEPWRQQALSHAWKKWRDIVKQRYGSPYSEYQDADDVKARCERIGFGQDSVGNIGTYVSCQVKAKPCTLLIKRTDGLDR